MTDAAPQRIERKQLIALALEQGVRQVEAAGSPLHPLLFDDHGTTMLLYDERGGTDPMELACTAIRERAPGTEYCAPVIDTRITFTDGKPRARS